MIKIKEPFLKIEYLETFFNDYDVALSTSLSIYKEQLDNFHQDCQGFIKNQLSEYKEKLQALHKEWIPKKEEFINYNRLNACDYNIFHIIGHSKSYPKGYCDLEVVTHSPFLADLLDPRGKHGQQDLFYKHFIMSIDKIDENKRKLFLDIKAEDYVVCREDNNIDILIRSFKKDNEFAVIIENKIDAKDQDKQLQRYYDHVRSRFSFKPEQILLIYLTKDGRAPSPESIDGFNERNVLYYLSYKKISECLKKCKELIPTKVSTVLDQYITVIDNFN